MSFLDALGDSVINGLNKAVDSEFAEVARVGDDRMFTTATSATPTVPVGNAAADAGGLMGNKALLIGGGLLLLIGAYFMLRK